jgi:N-acetyl sugar amidotransferase
MPDTRPGMKFNEDGICYACVNAEKKKDINWDARYKELEKLCEKHRKINPSGHNCVIAVSGGKDSYRQVEVMKKEMKMNPLLVKVEDNFKQTNAGIHNLKNLSETFGCDVITLKPNLKVEKILTRKMFEKSGKPNWLIDRLIYAFPIRIAVNFKIPLVIYGENINYEYGETANETPSAHDQINNNVAEDLAWDELVGDGVTKEDLAFCAYPTPEQIKEANLEPIFLSYFIRWSDYGNYLHALKHGFHDLSNEWRREHMFDDYIQVDSVGYLIHPWLKYPKFGHGTTTDHITRLVRDGFISRDEAVEEIKKRDHRLDKKALQDFLDFTGYTAEEFWQIVDKFYNKDLFEKDEFGQWQLKTEVGAV